MAGSDSAAGQCCPGIHRHPQTYRSDLRASPRGISTHSGHLEYVDDLLISGEGKNEVSDATISLFNFLGQKGLRISQNKQQFVEKRG